MGDLVLISDLLNLNYDGNLKDIVDRCLRCLCDINLLAIDIESKEFNEEEDDNG